MELNANINISKLALKALIGGSDDIIFFDFTCGEYDACAVYVDSITDRDMLGMEVISPLKKIEGKHTVTELSKSVTLANVELVSEIRTIADLVLGGHTAILFNGKKKALSVDLKKFETRSIAEPPTGFSIRGPRSGFTESIKTNLSLMRRYLKTDDFIVEMSEVGKMTKTGVALLYIKGIADENLVKGVRARLGRIKTDGVPDSSYIAKHINERRGSLFKQVGSTERPDVMLERLLEGRVGIIVDGSPFVLTLPYLLVEDFQSAEDYYISKYRANVVRAIRIIALLFSILLPSLFVSAQLFHIQLLPQNFLLTIINSIKGIPLSPSLEMFFILLIFEILNETSVRMPKYVGMALGVVGALVLGETLVHAGIVSTPAVLIMALSGISIYTVPEIVETTSILRLIFLILAGSVGGYGIILISAFMLCYLTTSDNYGVPYLAPYAPLIASDMQDGFQMKSITDMKRRPVVFASRNKTRRGKENA